MQEPSSRMQLARELLAEKGKSDMSRREIRQQIKISGAKPHARIPSRTRTGTTRHFAMWMSDLRRKSALQKLKTAKVALAAKGALPPAYLALHDGGFRNVFDLAQADRRDLIAVKGIGPAKLALVKEDLASRDVQVIW